jgi:hypothetical protein
MTYAPGTDQSRIFVASHSEFLRLPARDVQSILRERFILVHGNQFDFNYGWDLESFGRLHDVDRKVTVHGEIGVPFSQPVFNKNYNQFQQNFIPTTQIFAITRER